MSDFDEAERRVLAALFLDWYREGDQLLGPEELREIYGVSISNKLSKVIAADLQQRGLVFAWEEKESAAACVTDGTYKAARRAVMEELGSPPTFEVDWAKEEVLTEAEAPEWFPIPNGWKWFTVEPKKAAYAVKAEANEPAPTKKRDWHLIVAAATLAATIIIGAVTILVT